MQPFQPVIPHPFRRPLNRAGVKVECRSDADHDGVDLAAVFGHPAFLFRAAQADPDGAGAAVVDLAGQFGVFLFREGAEGR